MIMHNNNNNSNNNNNNNNISIFTTVIYASFLVQIPKKGKIYSVNEGNAKNWDAPTAKYVDLVLFADIAVS